MEDFVSDPSLPKATNLRVELLSGMISGILCSLAFFPLENAEARMQVASSSTKRGSPKVASATGSSPFSTMSGTFRHVCRTEGWRGLFRGLTPTVIGNALNWSLYFSIYHGVRSSLHDPSSTGVGVPATVIPANAINDLIAGCISGTICATLANPFWVLKLRLITKPPPPPGTRMISGGFRSEVRQILRREGAGAFFKGLTPSLLGVSEGALQFMAYDQIKSSISGGTGVMGPGGQLFAGAASKLVAILVTYPYQLLRSALQANNCPYNGMVDAATRIVKEEGFGGLYKGMPLNIIRQLPPSAALFLFVEQLRVVLIHSGAV